MQEYEDIFLEETPAGLPPLCGIEHQIDLIPGATLPNRPAYRTNPKETKEIQRQVQALLDKGYVLCCSCDFGAKERWFMEDVCRL